MIHMSLVKIPVKKLIQVCPADLLRCGRIGKEEEELIKQEVRRLLRMTTEKIRNLTIIKKSIDARKGQQIHYNYRLTFTCNREEMLVKRYGRSDVIWEKEPSIMTNRFTLRMIKPEHRTVVVGFGPAGMFAALELARLGYEPLVIERGYDVERRQKEVEAFWNGGRLNPECNVQFGEGGAGTFSDGKLNTMIKDSFGTHQRVLQTFVDFGAPSEILYLHKPHIGTDRLKDIVKAIRNEIISLGGEIWFGTRLDDIVVKKGALKELVLTREGETFQHPCEKLVLAIGHSARDTLYQLFESGVNILPKPFAIGARLEHPQEMIGRNQYGEYYKNLPVADYKVTHQITGNRGVYSFCMCPGGYVVNASSEEGRLVVNGMSNFARDGVNANSAIVVTVSPEDFGGRNPLAGVEFQRKYEEAAFLQAGGKIPVQLLGDFIQNRKSTSLGDIVPQIKGEYALGNVREILPKVVGDSIAEAISVFGTRIKDFDREDAVFSGLESRTSSPVRILRNEFMLSSVRGIYPCGEGAGYAGGIVSAAVDGLRVVEKIIM